MDNKKLVIERRTGTIEYQYNDEKNRVKTIGSTIYITTDSWGDTPCFVGTINPEDCWYIADLSKDEKLINEISYLDEGDLEKVRNFCESAGLIK